MYAPASATVPPVAMVGFNIFAVAAQEAADIEAWPEHHAVFQIFNRLSTQWQVGMGGATGLRYEALYPLIDRLGLDSDEWDLLLDDIQTMEHAALEAMSEKT